MKSWKKSLTAIAAGAVVALGGIVGIELVRDVQFAHAEQRVEATREQLASVEDLSHVFREVGKVVEPSVVQIEVRKQIPGRSRLPFNEDQLRRFFPDRDGDGEPDLPPGLRGEQGGVEMGTGSGVIMEVDGDTGYIVTNNHVAGDAQEMTVTLSDGRQIDNAKLVGADPKTDLAVVKITADHLIAARWGDSSKLDRGDWIMAFGSPFGYVGSMTHGIVSALNRNNIGILGAGGYEDFIQVDAPINPGNSGGPLVNIRGNVVGINTAIATRSGGFQGIGFAIPSNQAKIVFEQLKEKGKVSRGWLGISISDINDVRNPGLAESFGYEGKGGVLVQNVFAGTPAYGILQAGDILVKMNDKPLANMQELRNAIAALPAGTEVKFEIFREKKTQSVSVKLAEQPDDVMAAAQEGEGGASASAKAGELGIELQTVTSATARRLGYANAPSVGAIVTEVAPMSPAARAGIRPGDIITRVNDELVKTADDAQSAISKADLNKGLRMYVTSREGSRFVFVRGK